MKQQPEHLQGNINGDEMIDAKEIKERVNCRDIVEQDLGQPRHRSQAYDSYRCPLHNEQKGSSLIVYDDYWRCFGKCSRGGDVIAWVQVYHDLSFQDACDHLARGTSIAQTSSSSRHTGRKSLTYDDKSELMPDASWQDAARGIIQQAEANLWRAEGEQARAYLMGRGLNEETIKMANLGFIPGDYQEWRTINGLNVPCGITIPWLIDGDVWGVKVRRSAGEQRYQQIRGSKLSNALYLADRTQVGQCLLITEGEFDALIAYQVASDMVSVVSIGSASNSNINTYWYSKFLISPRLLVCMDDDPAGYKAAREITDITPAAYYVSLPRGKDINDFYQQSGAEAMRAWLLPWTKHE